MSALESVNDLAHRKQITELTESACGDGVVSARQCLTRVRNGPIRPCCRNKRSTAVWQDDKDEQHAASFHAANHGQSLALERMAFPSDRHKLRMIAVMGSLSPLPSMKSARNGWFASWSIGSATGVSSA
jgi:hypothetical protein